MERISVNGECVTHSPEQWKDTDYEMVATQFSHPSIIEGQHTNGPASIWVRQIGGEWHATGMCHAHKVRALLVVFGLEWFRDSSIAPMSSQGESQ